MENQYVGRSAPPGNDYLSVRMIASWWLESCLLAALLFSYKLKVIIRSSVAHFTAFALDVRHAYSPEGHQLALELRHHQASCRSVLFSDSGAGDTEETEQTNRDLIFFCLFFSFVSCGFGVFCIQLFWGQNTWKQCSTNFAVVKKKGHVVL